jgi:hypothetical protein
MDDAERKAQHAARARARYWEDPEAGRARQRKFRESHPEWYSEWAKKNSEKLREMRKRADAKTKVKQFTKLEEAAGRPCPNLCEICGGPPREGYRLHFDHDHETDEFRGWICFTCNTALGLVKDDPAHLEALAYYLRCSSRYERKTS